MKPIFKSFIGIIAIVLTSCAVIGEEAPTIEPGRSDLSSITTWQIQYTGDIDPDIEVGVFNLDLFDSSPELISEFHQNGIFVMCYFSAGSYEDWRSDSYVYPEAVLGKKLGEWPGEIWLDIRRIDILKPILEGRLDLAVVKGCDGVDPDNLDGYQNDTGFNLTATDQLAFNKFLSEAAHDRGLSVGLKNDIHQTAELVSFFDWIITEECFFYNECDYLSPFIDDGKPVFNIEYDLAISEFCPDARQMGINALHKNLELDAYRFDCQQITFE